MYFQALVTFSIILSSCFCLDSYYSHVPSLYNYAPRAVYHAPVSYAHALHPDVEKIDPNPSYHFKYGVNDPSTGDYKTQEEYRKDGIVQGSYSLAEPDGTIRTVHYTADHLHGFNAVVNRHSAKAVAAVPHAPAAIYAPRYHAPFASSYYHPPTVAHSLPAYHYTSPYSYHK